MQRRADMEAERGQRLAGRKPKAPPETVPATTRVNITDPDSLPVKAEIIGNGVDWGLLEPAIDAARGQLAAAGIIEQIGVVLADAGY
jgi:hypothetical protein